MTVSGAVAVVARVVVGLVLVAAGALKLSSREWSSQAAGFGTPRWLVPVVPWVEIVLGALLVPGVGGRITAIAAAALLAAFTVVVAVRVAQRSTAPCACFGSLSARPVGPATLARNVVLLALAVVAAL